MELVYLAIENHTAVHERESKFWLSHNVSSIRVSSMSEGIEKAVARKFLYIGINADNIDYKPHLRFLREVTNDPILISTTSYTMQEQGEAIKNGADLFGQISDIPSDNYLSVMACINRLYERANQQKPQVQLLSYDDIMIAPLHHTVFITDAEIHPMSKNEMEVFHYLTINRNRAVTHGQIHAKLSETNEIITPNFIYSMIKRLRKKIFSATQFDYIKTVRGVGYRFITEGEKIKRSIMLKNANK